MLSYNKISISCFMAERDKELGRSFVYPKTLAKSERTIIKKARFVDTPKPVKYPFIWRI